MSSFEEASGELFRVRTYREGDEADIQALYSDIFGRERPLEEWRWRFREGPCGPALIHVLELSDEIVGHYAHVPLEAYVDNKKVSLVHAGDLMVRPDLRGRGGMQTLVRRYLEDLRTFDVRMNFPTDEAGRLGERYGAGRLLGRIPRWVCVHSAAYLMQNRGLTNPLAARVVNAVLSTVRRFAQAGTSAFTFEFMNDLGSDVDELAAESANFASSIRLRNSRYLRWRWLDQPDTSWRILSARDAAGGLRGWVVFGIDERPHYKGAEGGYIADVLAKDAAATRALLAKAADNLFEMGCPIATLNYQDPRPWSARACRRAGFFARGEGPNVLCRSLSDRAGSVVENLDHWYLTRGDTDLA